ncbi:MBL fold metallo-hydrolase [Methanolinea mesophila]|uniref:MBL fold metallo-hydrolase n=1 Tax=Methanolinea mesophila TaxID=547055 RepID=UPI001AE6A946
MPEVIPVRLGITTAFIVRQKGVILVDTGFPGSADTILRVMEQNTIAPRDVRLILLTHGHADHAGSAAELRARTGAGVAIHPADAEMLRCGDQGCLRPTSLLGRVLGPFFGGKKKSSFPSLDPDLVLREGMSLEPYGISGTVLCTPGHTPGSVSILLSSGDALAGDLLFAHPPSGRPGLPFWAEDVETAKMSIRTLLSYHPARIHIAHGAMVRGDAVKIP